MTTTKGGIGVTQRFRTNYEESEKYFLNFRCGELRPDLRRPRMTQYARNSPKTTQSSWTRTVSSFERWVLATDRRASLSLCPAYNLPGNGSRASPFPRPTFGALNGARQEADQFPGRGRRSAPQRLGYALYARHSSGQHHWRVHGAPGALSTHHGGRAGGAHPASHPAAGRLGRQFRPRQPRHRTRGVGGGAGQHPGPSGTPTFHRPTPSGPGTAAAQLPTPPESGNLHLFNFSGRRLTGPGPAAAPELGPQAARTHFQQQAQGGRTARAARTV